MIPKFKYGHRVLILSRKEIDPNVGWENTGVGSEAIVLYSASITDAIPDTYDKTKPLYSLFVLFNNEIPRKIVWYEEKYLELVCSNVDKGIAIIQTQ